MIKANKDERYYMKKVFTVLLLILVAIGGFFFYNLNRRGSTEMSTKYDEFSFICEGEDIPKEDFAKIEGQYYLSLDFIKEYLDDTVTYDEEEQTVIFSNEVGNKRIKVSEDTATLNGQEIGVRDPVIVKDKKVFVPSEIFIYDYPVTLKFIEDKNLLVLDRNDREYSIGTTPSDGLNIREKDSINSPIVSVMYEGDEVYVYGETGDFYKVREVEGYAGYVKKSMLDVKFPEDRFTKEIEVKNKKTKPVNMTWDYTYSTQSLASIDEIKKIEGLNVISPTWFSLANSSGADRKSVV